MDANQPLQKIFDAKAATGTGTALLVEDFDHVVLTLDTASSASGTIKFQISMQDSFPNFAGAQTATNQWDYVEVVDLEDGSIIDGDTGVALTGTDDHRHFEANVSAARWICATITSYAAGAWTVQGKPFRSA